MGPSGLLGSVYVCPGCPRARKGKLGRLFNHAGKLPRLVASAPLVCWSSPSLPPHSTRLISQTTRGKNRDTIELLPPPSVSKTRGSHHRQSSPPPRALHCGSHDGHYDLITPSFHPKVDTDRARQIAASSRTHRHHSALFGVLD